jgi:hypothetical protein
MGFYGAILGLYVNFTFNVQFHKQLLTNSQFLKQYVNLLTNGQYLKQYVNLLTNSQFLKQCVNFLTIGQFANY